MRRNHHRVYLFAIDDSHDVAYHVMTALDYGLGIKSHRMQIILLQCQMLFRKSASLFKKGRLRKEVVGCSHGKYDDKVEKKHIRMNVLGKISGDLRCRIGGGAGIRVNQDSFVLGGCALDNKSPRPGTSLLNYSACPTIPMRLYPFAELQNRLPRLSAGSICQTGVLLQPFQQGANTPGCQSHAGVCGPVIEMNGIAIRCDRLSAREDYIAYISASFVRRFRAEHPTVSALQAKFGLVQIKERQT